MRMDPIRIGEVLLRRCVPLHSATTCHRMVTRQCQVQYLPSLLPANPSRAFQTSARRTVEDDTSTQATRRTEGRAETDALSRIMETSFGTLSSRSSNGFADDGPRRGSSVDDLMLSALGTVGRNRNRNNPNATASQAEFNVEQMLNPLANPSSAGNRLPPVTPDTPLPFKLGPSVGRMVSVDAARNMDVGRAFRQLEIVCNRNKVRQDFTKQKFHERPGLKRKRLKTLRWRRRFKEGFKGIVQKVMDMKKQGW